MSSDYCKAHAQHHPCPWCQLDDLHRLLGSARDILQQGLAGDSWRACRIALSCIDVVGERLRHD